MPEMTEGARSRGSGHFRRNCRSKSSAPPLPSPSSSWRELPNSTEMWNYRIRVSGPSWLSVHQAPLTELAETAILDKLPGFGGVSVGRTLQLSSLGGTGETVRWCLGEKAEWSRPGFIFWRDCFIWPRRLVLLCPWLGTASRPAALGTPESRQVRLLAFVFGPMEQKGGGGSGDPLELWPECWLVSDLSSAGKNSTLPCQE